MTRKRRIEFNETLNEASAAYYDKPTMNTMRCTMSSNHLKEAGYTLLIVQVRMSDTQFSRNYRRRAEVVCSDKTKSRELASWLGDHEGLLSWKLDGLTVNALTYEGGELVRP